MMIHSLGVFQGHLRRVSENSFSVLDGHGHSSVVGPAPGRILKLKVATGPFPIGVSPPARVQTYEYALGVARVSNLTDCLAALLGLGPLPSTSGS